MDCAAELVLWISLIVIADSGLSAWISVELDVCNGVLLSFKALQSKST